MMEFGSLGSSLQCLYGVFVPSPDEFPTPPLPAMENGILRARESSALSLFREQL